MDLISERSNGDDVGILEIVDFTLDLASEGYLGGREQTRRICELVAHLKEQVRGSMSEADRLHLVHSADRILALTSLPGTRRRE